MGLDKRTDLEIKAQNTSWLGTTNSTGFWTQSTCIYEESSRGVIAIAPASRAEGDGFNPRRWHRNSLLMVSQFRPYSSPTNFLQRRNGKSVSKRLSKTRPIENNGSHVENKFMRIIFTWRNYAKTVLDKNISVLLSVFYWINFKTVSDYSIILN